MSRIVMNKTPKFSFDFSKWFILLSKVFGVLPMHHTDRKSNIHDYLGILLIPIGYAAALLGIYMKQTNVLELSDCFKVCLISNTTLLFLGIFSYLICVYCCLSKKKFFVEFTAQLHEFDGQFSSIELKNTLRLERDYVKVTVFAVTIVSLCVALVWDIRSKFLSYQKDFVRILLSVSGLIFPFLASALVEAQFVMHIEAIVERFQKINFILASMDKEASLSAKDYFDLSSSSSSGGESEQESNKKRRTKKKKRMRNLNNKHGRKTDTQAWKETVERISVFNVDKLYSYDAKKLQLNNTKNKIDFKSKATDRIETINVGNEVNKPGYERFLTLLFKLHNHLNEMGDRTNVEYSLQVVLYMTSTFIVSMIGIFLATKVLFTMKGKATVIDNLALTFVVWTIFFLVVAYLVLRLCCQAHNESRKSALLIHEIMQKKPSFMIEDDRYYMKMKNFTLQYLHWERYFQFNGTGLFALDYAFLFSAVSAATSHLIVLLQFDMTSILEV